MNARQIRERIEIENPIEQTPPDWLNQFETRAEAWSAWIDSQLEIALHSHR